MGKLSFFDRIYCWLNGIDTNEVTDVHDYYGNTVIFHNSKKESNDD